MVMLTRLRLKNIKSYRDAEIHFEEGINGINGENGHGKTTILEAIGYILFDFLPNNKHQYLLRRGARSGSIELEFIADDGITYTLRRKVGGSEIRLSTPIGEITGKKDVQDWLIDNLFPHLTDPKELSSLFENTIGVPQGTFTAAFLLRPSDRKKVFDEVLGVDEYKKAYENLRKVINLIEEDLQELKDQQLILQTRTEDYERLKKEKIGIEAEIAQLAGRIQDSQKELEALKARREELETQQKLLQKVENELEVFERSKNATEEHLARVKKDIERAETAERLIAELADEKNEYEESEKTLRSLYARREERNRDERRVQELKHDLERLREKQQRKEELEREISRLNSEIEELLPLAEREDALNHEIERVENELKEPLQRLISEKRQLQQEQRRIDELKMKIETLKREKEELLPLLQKQIGLTREIEEKSQSIAVIASEIRELQEGLAQAGEKNLCPILKGVECKEVPSFKTYFTHEINKRQRILETIQTEHKVLQKELEALENPSEEIAKKDALIADAIQELERLEGIPERIRENSERLRVLSEKFQRYLELTGEAGDEERVKSILSELKKKLEALGDAKRELSKKEALIERMKKEVGELSEVHQQIKESEDKLKVQTSALRKYAGLDATITVIEAKVQKLKSAYDLYLQNKPIVERKSEYINEYKRVSNRLKEEEARIERLTAEQKSLLASFNESEFQQTIKEVEELDKKLSRYQTSYNEKNHQLEKLQQELSRMKSELEELKRVEERLEEEREFYSYVSLIRDLLNTSGQLIVLELINQIGREASNIYCEIMDDHSLDLRWSDDYDIIVMEGGEERGFAQLSGGEEMSAALAVRLALLKVISKSDIMFLDEPTQNLDSRRRENLSQQIRRIHGFKQLFVISHDDTFNEECDHVIHVEKVDGESRVRTTIDQPL